MLKKTSIGILGVVLSAAACAAPNPVSYDKMVEYVAAHSGILTAANWAAACTTGSPLSANGCYGDAASTGFARINRGLGGYSSYSGINISGSVAGSIFIKAFLANANTPIDPENISVTLASGYGARCSLFTQEGAGINGVEGMGNSGSNGTLSGPQAAQITTVSSAQQDIKITNAAPAVINAPLYILCVGFNTTDNSTISSILNQVTAV